MALVSEFFFQSQINALDEAESERLCVCVCKREREREREREKFIVASFTS